MKNIVLVILLTICLFAFPLIVYGQVKDTFLSTPSATIEDYTLPYPGLLPDNPLYLLKVTRDRIIEFLIADPLKKSEFYLLESDKRLSAGTALLKRRANKLELAYSTISKSENYFQKAITQAKEAKKQGKDITDLAKNLARSLKKHQAIITSLEEKGPKDLRDKFTNSSKRLIDFDSQVGALLPN